MSLAAAVRRRLHQARLDSLTEDQLIQKLQRKRGVLMLCYHAISRDFDAYPYQTSPAAFDQQLGLLKEIFDVLPIGDAVALLKSDAASRRSRPAVVLTFDDGYRDNWSEATPLLERHELPATLFAPRELIKSANSSHLSESELLLLAEHSLWQIGAHGLSHNVLTGFLPQDIHDEMVGCRIWLEDLLGKAPIGFAYPQGQISPTVIAAARETYEYAFSTDRRLAERFDPWAIRRYCPTQIDDDPAQFLRSMLSAPMEDGS